MKPNQAPVIKGRAHITASGNRLTVDGLDDVITAAITDVLNTVVYMYFSLGYWYHIMTKPNKTLQVSGLADIEAEGDKLTIDGVGGLLTVCVMDIRGIVIYMYHPLSKWYVETDTRTDKAEDNADHA